MTRILLRARKGPFHVVSPEVTLERNTVGTNSGNLIFSGAVHKILQTPRNEIEPNQFRADVQDADRINAEYDAFVVPLANAFRPSFQDNLIKLTALIEKIRIPVIVFGVGAQTDLNYDLARLEPINDTVRRFARAVLERSPSIGVRGELTQEYLHRLGFSDIDVIGCPSMFLYGENLRVEKRGDKLESDGRLAINVSPYVKEMGDIVMAHHERYPNMRYIAQDTKTLEMMLWGDTAKDVGKSAKRPTHTSHPLYQENKIRYFIDPWPWIEYLKDFQFSFGTRIHGNIAALLAGTPSYVLCHDSRTLELARYFEIPHRKMTDLTPDLDAADLYAEADFDAMHKGHQARLQTTIDFMEKHDLDHVFGYGAESFEFDKQLAKVTFPPAVETLASPDTGELAHRLRWLRDNNVRLRREVADLNSRIEPVERLLKKMENFGRLTKKADKPDRNTMQGSSGPLGRFRRAAGRAFGR